MIGDPYTEALRAPSPCQRYRCEMVPVCATGQACAAFVRWVETGRYIDPRLRIPSGRSEAGRMLPIRRKDKHTWLEAPEPTVEIFVAVMGEKK
jgi:hypothetical protein